MEQGRRDKTGVCGLNTYTVMMDIIQVIFFLCVDTIVRIEASSETKVEERTRYAKWNERWHTSCSDWQ